MEIRSRGVNRIWAYRNTLLLVVSFIAIFLLMQTETAHAVIALIGSFGYASAVAVGFFFVSTFTVAPAAIVLFHLAEELQPVLNPLLKRNTWA